jgi:hypothetical protein
MMDTVRHPDDPMHIAVCAECRRAAHASLGGVDLGRVWVRVAADAWAEPAGRVERVAGAVLRSRGLARALVTTPSLIASWIGATVVVLIVGAIATRSTGEPWVALLAPALAGVGIAYAYGPGIDPAFELGRSMAIPDRLILIVRALAVFGINAGLGLVAMLFAREASGLTLGWLAPMTAVAALALAIATWTGSPNVGVAGALAGWAMVVLAVEAGRGDAADAVANALVPVYAAVAVALTAVALYATSSSRGGAPRWG